MALSLLRRLLAGQYSDHAVLDWPVIDAPAPEVNVAENRFGRLKFGAPLDDAHYLGKPESCRRIGRDYLELVYARAGFQVDFDHGLLAYGAFFVGPDEAQPATEGLTYCFPALEGGPRFTPQTSRADLEKVFGPPDQVDAMDADDVIVTFRKGDLVLEFEMNLAGGLKRWNIYPEKQTSR